MGTSSEQAALDEAAAGDYTERGQTVRQGISFPKPSDPAATQPAYLKFLSLGRRDLLLLAEALLAVAAVRLALLIVPLKALHSRVIAHAARSKAEQRAPGRADPERIAWAVAAAGARLPGGTCLPRALALQWLLARRAESSVVHVGFLLRESGEVRGHAWLEHRGEVLIGGGELSRFSRSLRLVVKVGPDGGSDPQGRG